jgi:hypothetical protein
MLRAGSTAPTLLRVVLPRTCIAATARTPQCLRWYTPSATPTYTPVQDSAPPTTPARPPLLTIQPPVYARNYGPSLPDSFAGILLFSLNPLFLFTYSIFHSSSFFLLCSIPHYFVSIYASNFFISIPSCLPSQLFPSCLLPSSLPSLIFFSSSHLTLASLLSIPSSFFVIHLYHRNFPFISLCSRYGGWKTVQSDKR